MDTTRSARLHSSFTRHTCLLSTQHHHDYQHLYNTNQSDKISFIELYILIFYYIHHSKVVVVLLLNLSPSSG